MIRDPGNRLRHLLQQDPHTFTIKVDTPWQNHPDLEEYNKPIFQRLCFLLNQFKRHTPENPATSQGIVLLGEAGSGKTHLLMRVAKQLSKDHYVLFVPKPNNEDAVYLHTWSNIVQSLSEIVPNRSQDRSQLDDLLAHVFSAVLRPRFEAGGEDEQRWARRLAQDPMNLFTMLGEGEQATRNRRKIRNLTLEFLTKNHPQIDQVITRALIAYAFSGDNLRRRQLLTWLAGQGGLDATEAESLRLPVNWVETAPDASHTSYLQQREDQAFRAIVSLGILSTYYQPLILAYDQLEGLRTRETLTRKWSEAVREIINYSPNFLVITCVFPDIWTRWIEANWIEVSAAQRIGPRQLTLERFTAKHAYPLLESQTGAKARNLGLSTPIYPFETTDIATICEQTTTPRQFLLEAQTSFENWLFDSEDEIIDLGSIELLDQQKNNPQSITPPHQQRPSLHTILEKELARLEQNALQMLNKRVPNEEDLFGRIHNIVEVLLQDFTPRFRRAELGRRVMPFNIVILQKESPGLCLSILNSAGNSLTARLRNLNEVARDKQTFGQVIVVRDQRCGNSGVGPVGMTLLKNLEKDGNIYLQAGETELARIHAIYDAIVAIEQQDLRADSRFLTHSDLVNHLRVSGYLRSCQLFVRAAELSSIFNCLLYEVWSNDPPPQEF